MKISESKSGLMIIPAVIFVVIFTILLLKGNRVWSLEIKRDAEKELIFRGKQFVYAIEKYNKKHMNVNLKDLKILFKKRFIRKLYRDPMSSTGEWNIVMKSTRAGNKNNKLLIVPESMLSAYLNQAKIIGVSSTSDDIGYYEYRTKKIYNEWAFYVGAKENKEMPTLKFVKE